jgi:hypothetical protein
LSLRIQVAGAGSANRYSTLLARRIACMASGVVWKPALIPLPTIVSDPLAAPISSISGAGAWVAVAAAA